MKSKVKVNFLYNTLYHIFLIIVPLITTPYISRTLGAAGIGDYAFAYSIAHYFSLFIKLGLDNYGNRAVAYIRHDKEKLSAEFWNIFCFQFILSIVIVSIYLIYSIWIASNSIISIYLVLYVISSGIDITWFFRGMEEFKITVTRSFIIKVLSVISVFLFVKNENDTGIYTLIMSIGFLGSQIFLWPRLFRYVFFVKPARREVTKHIKPNLVLFLPAIAVSLYKIMDKIMLGLMSNTVEVGYYESSEKIIKIPMAIIESLGTVMQPRMSNLVARKADNQYLTEVLEKSLIVASELVPLFYAPGFEKCIILFRLLLPSCMFLSFTNVLKSQYLLPRKKDKEYIIALFTGAGVNLITNSVLIPINQSIGASIGTLFAEMSVCIIIGLIIRKEMNVIKLSKISIPFILSGLIMFLAGKDLRISAISPWTDMFIKVIICSIIYIASLLILVPVSDRLLSTNIRKETFGFISGIKKNNI